MVFGGCSSRTERRVVANASAVVASCLELGDTTGLTMPNRSPLVQRLQRFAIPGAALVLALVSIGYAVRNCAQDQRERAYAERQVPLAKSFKQHRDMLSRAAALQPNFKELTSEIAPSRCRELQKLVQAQYPLDPFHVDGRCEQKAVTASFPLCEGTRVFADLGGGESQHGQKVGVILQARRRGNEPNEPRLLVQTLLLDDNHAIVELHELAFEGDSMSAMPQTTTIRSFGADGLLERVDKGERTELRATTPDGALQLSRQENASKSEVLERVRGAGMSGWSAAYLLPTSGAWYATPHGLSCTPPSFSELEILRRDGAVACSWVRVWKDGSVKQWPRGSRCPSDG